MIVGSAAVGAQGLTPVSGAEAPFACGNSAPTPKAALPNGAFLLSSPGSLALLDSARSELFAYRMPRAERLLQRLARRADGRFAAWFHLTSAALHRALMSDVDEHFTAFDARRDTLVKGLDSLPRSVWRDYMFAEVRLWDAVAHLKRGRYVRGALAARPAYHRFASIVEAHPDFCEPYKGLGLLHLSIGSMPSAFRFILKILGYGGTISGGLDEIRRAYRQSHYNRVEAGIYLAFANAMLFHSEDEGLQIMQEFFETDTTSTLFAHLYGFMLLANRRTDQAADVLGAAVSRSESADYFYNHYLDFYLAESHFRSDQFEQAETWYRSYIDRHPGPALKALSNLGLGRAVEMQGRRAEAMKYYERVQAARAFDTDAASRREAERLLERPLAGVDSVLLLGRNAYDSGRYDRAEKLLKEILEETLADDDQRAEAAYRLGRVYSAKEMHAEAIAHYGRAITYQRDSRARYAPWGWFYIGKIWMSQGLTAQALDAFERARAYGGKFDYYQALDQGIRGATEMAGGE